MDIFAARKTRDTIMKMLYTHIFNFIISTANLSFKTDTCKVDRSINILDIAGFGIIC